MEWNNQRITELTWKYIKEELSASEREELDAWLSDPYNRARFEERVKAENILEGLMIWNLANGEAEKKEWSLGQEVGGAKILPMGEFSRRNVHRGRWIAAAAAVVVLAGTAALWTRFQKNDIRQVKVAAAPTMLPPGKNKAVLILADGKTVNLDDASKGTVAQQGGAEAVKEDSGQLVYHNKGSAVAVENTIATPRGGQYRVVLPDGSKVWLNAASSIKFPTNFSTAERKVEITGEVYFEVVHNATIPFHVAVNGMDVEVLGTYFNINAYADEPVVRTTLLEGSVRVAAAASSPAAGVNTKSDKLSVVLKPGQQAQLVVGVNTNNGSQLKVVSEVDVEGVVAWKNGFFQFDGADIQTVMRAVSRWYNVKVRYEGEIPNVRASGSISRDNMASTVLEVLQASGFHFRIEGDTIIITP
jgi:transmembrane sensor